MKFLRLAALLLTFSSFSFAVNKDLVQLQRDLEDKLNSLQNDVDSKLSELNGMVTAMQNDSRRTADQVASLQDQVTNGVAKSLGPVAGLNSKVESMANDLQALQAAISDLSTRLERMDAKMTDLKNQMQIMQNPPAAPGAASPGSAGPGGPQGQSAPPPGMSADQTYTSALRDLQTGKTDLAQQEFQQYLQYFPNTELAANAQYYLGEIAYNRGDFQGAVTAFDAVLEHYPENPKTPDAHYMKAMALLKANERSRAVQEFRLLVQNYPHTEDARKALSQLRALGVSAGSTTARRKSS
ncbi:MAG: tetratricopeptide repeat protein [Acidobacteriaceae bacterium]|nr:tetratricopeptide repeat protein [Acidobacteriaceae bacterium]MBV8570544.1 tetratricopeptide repeat protein [Acidobacteriaceae bacterium]